jgi:hypothetical protein
VRLGEARGGDHVRLPPLHLHLPSFFQPSLPPLLPLRCPHPIQTGDCRHLQTGLSISMWLHPVHDPSVYAPPHQISETLYYRPSPCPYLPSRSLAPLLAPSLNPERNSGVSTDVTCQPTVDRSSTEHDVVLTIPPHRQLHHVRRPDNDHLRPGGSYTMQCGYLHTHIHH